MKRETKSKLAKIALLCATLIWGGSFVVLKNAISSLPTFYVLAIRGTIAVIILSAIFWKNFKNVNRTYIWHGAVMGTLLIMAYGLQTLGLTTTTPGKNAFLTSVYCVLVPFFYWIFTRIRPDRYNVLAAVLCIIGIGFVALRGESIAEGGALISTGDILTLASGCLYALHIVAVARFASQKDVVLLTIIQFIVYSAWAWIIAFLFEEAPVSISGAACS